MKSRIKQKKQAWRIKQLVGGIGILLGLALVWWYWWSTPLLSPLSELTTFKFINKLTPNSHDKIVYGFLPYWNLEDAEIQPEVTNLAYFGLTLQGDGTVMTRGEDGLEPGYNKLSSDKILDICTEFENTERQVEIVLTLFDNDEIVALLTNPQAAANLNQSLDSLILAYPIKGVNLDIEYSGPVTDQLRQQLTKLVASVNQHLDEKYDDINLSIDMYAGAASRYQLWDVAAISPHVDYIIVMAYDFHLRSSPTAGPVAPLFGGEEHWDSDINQHLANFLQVVPKEKILLGVPFYGYEWQTTTRDSQAHTFPQSGSTASYKRVQELLTQQSELDVQEHWNEFALSPYLSYMKDDEVFVVYYENSRSLSYKLDYVNQLDLGGIAIWALGYEDNNRELWEVIAGKL